MINVYKKYLIKKFLKKILSVSIVFLLLITILNIFEEISFFINLNANPLLPFVLTFLNAPSIIYEIFPFIFLISSLLFFLDLINNDELEVFKINGLNNLKIIRLLFFTSFLSGILIISVYYAFSSKLKHLYLGLKNVHSKDDKYLAMVTENGIWIKDSIEQNIFIINARKIDKNYLKDVLISEFDKNFNLIRIIRSADVDISNNEWLIYMPYISKDNISIKSDKILELKTHFNLKKINGLFSDLSSLNILELIKRNIDYKELGYSTREIQSHLNKILSLPVYLSIMTVLAAIIMLNVKRNKPMIFYLILSIFLSVVIYYFYYLFNLIGESGKIPIYISIWLPLFLLTIFITIGLVRINEK